MSEIVDNNCIPLGPQPGQPPACCDLPLDPQSWNYRVYMHDFTTGESFARAEHVRCPQGTWLKAERAALTKQGAGDERNER